jgi:hypothetical protein
MSGTQQAKFDTLRSLAFGSISGTYAAVGTKLTYPARLLVITNGTNGDLFLSTDGSNDMLFLAQNSFKLFDLSTNRLNVDQMFVVPAATQFYVKQSTAPSSGSVYIEVIYGVMA